MSLQSASRSKRPVSGILLLDKPAGISSHNALAKAKRLYMSPYQDSKKAGHTGTLDPMATGLLPICFGEATKFSSFGLDADKGYTAAITLGKSTNTGDQDGEVIDIRPVLPFEQDQLNALAQSLIGDQMQVPPMYSALKHDGKKLYQYAREGITLDRPARPITIRSLSLHKLSNDQIRLDVICSKGTYVRVLGEQIAQALGTLGHLTSLHRTLTGGFAVQDSYGLDVLERFDLDQRLACLLPIDALLDHLPAIALRADESARIRHGQRLNLIANSADRLSGLDFTDAVLQVRLYDDRFVGLGELSANGRLQPIRLISP